MTDLLAKDREIDDLLSAADHLVTELQEELRLASQRLQPPHRRNR